MLVLEDLHWSDYSTLDLVSYLARRRDPARLMVIGTYRPVDVILDEHPLKSVKTGAASAQLCHELALEYLCGGRRGVPGREISRPPVSSRVAANNL